MSVGLREVLRGAFAPSAPDGWFDSDLLWYDRGLGPGTWLSRGASLHLPDLKNADEATHRAYYEAFGVFLCQLAGNEALQFQWTIDEDYRAELEHYEAETRRQKAQGWCAHVRAERLERYRGLLRLGRLRRERLQVYLGRRCSNAPRAGFRQAGELERYLEQNAKNIAERLQQLGGQLPGARLDVLGTPEHHRALKVFCQPGLRVGLGEGLAGFDSQGSILENCWPGSGICTEDSEGHVFFKMDGHYHGLMVLRRWPMETHFGIIWALTGALAARFSFTLACRPLDTSAEVLRLEEEMRRIRGSRETEKKESLDDVLAMKKARITALQGGFARPFAVLPVLRVWDREISGVLSQMQALKEAVGNMAGAQCHQVDDPVQAQNLFYETLPGWLGGRYRGWDLFAMAGNDSAVCYLQDMIPLSSSYLGHPEAGEALYDGNEGNLVGVRSFSEGTPQHSVMIGTTRSGKSSQVIDYLSQSDCFFGFRGIIEEGLSYGTLVQLLGGESLILHPDGNLTLNYLDTARAPLSRQQVAASAGLLMVMSGAGGDPEQRQRRKAMLSEYLEQTYTDLWNDFRLRFPLLELEAARQALLIERRRKHAPTLAPLGFMELYADLMQERSADPDRHTQQMLDLSESEALAFARRPTSAALVRDIGMSLLPPEAFPTHTSLVEMLRYGRFGHHDRGEVDRLSSQLALWTRQGPYGRLFDGTSNRRLDGRLVHFELGFLSTASAEMKEAAVFLAANQLRQRIITLPRAVRKQFIFEEPARYLGVGGMEDLFAEFYAQMGKFGCQILPVTQQYGQLARSALRPVIFGNSKQFFLFRQNDRQDLDDIGNAVGLPEAARSAVRRFTAPEYQAGGLKYSEMAVFSVEGDRTQCGVVRNHVSEEMLYVSDSSGERFDARTRALRKHDNLLKGVIEETRRAAGSDKEGVAA